jgi:hypothetical protein
LLATKGRSSLDASGVELLLFRLSAKWKIELQHHPPYLLFPPLERVAFGFEPPLLFSSSREIWPIRAIARKSRIFAHPGIKLFLIALASKCAASGAFGEPVEPECFCFTQIGS